ncbi:MAG: hypothetical protein R3C11_04745 [Planctomycetaceae bacterium]
MIGLTDSMSTLSAYANDVGYDIVFLEPLKNFAVEGDMLITISGSAKPQRAAQLSMPKKSV